MKYSTKRTRKSISKKPILLVIIAAVLIIGVFIAYKSQRNANQPASGADTTSVEKIDLSPPTQEELKETADHKENLGSTPSTNTPPAAQPGGRNAVKPVITFADQTNNNTSLEVSSFIPSVVEEGGECTFTATKDSQTVTKKLGTLRSASSTSCKNFVIPSSEFAAKGSWKITVAYSSSVSYGVSDTSTVEIN